MRLLVAVLALATPAFAAISLSQAPASVPGQSSAPQTQLPDDGFGY